MAVFQDKKNKTKDGKSWYFSTYYSTLSGERKKYKSKKYSLKKEAEEAEMVFLLSLTDKIETKNMTFEDLFNCFMDFQKDKVKVSTYQNYPKCWKLIYNLKNIKLDQFNITHFNLWKTKMNEYDYSTRYKNNIYKFIKSLLNFGEKYYNFNFKDVTNKMTGFTNPNELKKEMLFWNYDEFKKFIEQEHELKYKAYFKILYYCGLRKGEANALNWNDVDFNNHTIYINKNVSLKITGKEYVILPPKTKSSIRVLPLPETVENDLKKLKLEYQKYDNYSNDWFVFGGPLPLKDSTVQKKKDENCVLSNIKQIRIHDFRHSCASLLISNGASISLVAKYLGHSNISTTLNTYTHMFKNELYDIINVINNL